jgi:hypothetical protein
MYYYWSYIVLGAVLVAVGALLTSAGWHFIGKCKKKRILKYIINTILILFIVGGPIIIAVGGILTTLGWNKLDNHEHKKALITAVSREWVSNEIALIGMDNFLLQDDEKLGEPRLLPRMRTSAMSLAFTSCLFDKGDKKLLNAIINYEKSATAFNTFLSNADHINTAKNISKEQRVKNFKAVKETDIFKSFRGKHKKMKEVLFENYKWSITGIDWSQ